MRVRRGRGIALLVLVSAFVPATVYLSNASKFPHPERVLAIVLAHFLLGLLWVVLLRRAGLAEGASLISAVVLIGLWSTQGALTASSTALAIGAVLGSSVLVALLASQVRPMLLRVALRIAGVFFATGIATVGVVELRSTEH